MTEEEAKDLYFTAVHEAGHAVLAHPWLCPLKSVMIDPSGAGLTSRVYATAHAWIELTISMAGGIAERAAGGDGGDCGDAPHIRKALAALSDEEAEMAISYCKAVIHNEWQALMAHVLISARYLDGDAVARIITDTDEHVSLPQ